MTISLKKLFRSASAQAVNLSSKSGAVWRTVSLFLLCIATALTTQAQVVTKLLDFNGINGADPVYMSLVQGPHGKLYGTTAGGGANGNYGTVFAITPKGRLTTLYSFCAQPGCADGSVPDAGLLLASDGNFYGTTSGGGANGDYGTVFKITAEGALTTLYSFCAQANCVDGSAPTGTLIQATDGNLYGTTNMGGANGDYGTVFRITRSGRLRTLYSFCGNPNCADGSNPVAGLVQATDGHFYGTTLGGGTRHSRDGTTFKITAGGSLTTLHSFGWDDGAQPYGGLVQASDGYFYGTTAFGGKQYCDTGCGSIFRMSPGGTVTTLYSFGHGFGGGNDTTPRDTLVQATDGNFYCTLSDGEAYGGLFRISPSGDIDYLYGFEGFDGAYSDAQLLQATNGIFYGAASGGGKSNDGTLFTLSVGLGPFVSFVGNPAKAGDTFEILGQGLTGTSSVSFNGTPATFTVKSDNWLTAAVPDGGTTGPVTVTTPSGTLASNQSFRVLPQLLSFDPPSGQVGTPVTITGISLTQTFMVGFGDHVAAQFTVDSDGQVTAIVPEGANTGKIGIRTPGGIAFSSSTFSVAP